MDRDMVGKVFTFGFVMLTLVRMLSATTDDCSDGTKYYACSSIQPGYACLPESTVRNTIQKVIGPDAPAALRSKCACSNFLGYVEINAECVKTTCTNGGQTYNNFACVQLEAGTIESDNWPVVRRHVAYFINYFAGH